jgi:hypothetical protein
LDERSISFNFNRLIAKIDGWKARFRGNQMSFKKLLLPDRIAGFLRSPT